MGCKPCSFAPLPTLLRVSFVSKTVKEWEPTCLGILRSNWPNLDLLKLCSPHFFVLVTNFKTRITGINFSFHPEPLFLQREV